MARMGKCKFDDLVQFRDRLDKLAKVEMQQFVESCAKELAARLLARVIELTPVGEYDEEVNFTAQLPEREVNFTTKSGKKVNFKAKAQVKQVSFTPKTGKQGGTLQKGWRVDRIRREGDVFTIEIANHVEYAPYVEYGHRTRNHKGMVKGKFMLRDSSQEIERDAPKILERKLKKKLEECFNGK